MIDAEIVVLDNMVLTVELFLSHVDRSGVAEVQMLLLALAVSSSTVCAVPGVVLVPREALLLLFLILLLLPLSLLALF